jgi:predicted NBD/HSP70 family sugar kinase
MAMGSFVPSDLKERNRATVYDILKAKGSISKADIARESGISAPTVIKIIDYFSSLGLVQEAGEGTGALGRRPQLLRFDPEAVYALGAEYDGVHLSVGVVDLSGGLHALVRHTALPDAHALLAEALEPCVAEALASAGIGADRVVGLGLGLPGTVDPARRILRFAPLVGVARPLDFGPLLDELEVRLGFPLVLENDANAAALGEFAARGLGPTDDLLFAVLGMGLGAGLVLEGKLRKGPRAFAGELGYLVFERDWTASLDAPGWLEGKTDLASFWREAARPEGPSPESLARVADEVSLCLADICIALDLERVVVGRVDHERFGPELLSRIAAGLGRLSVLDVSCEAARAPEPGVSGASSLAVEGWLRRVFAG